MDYYLSVLKNYVGFRGRARRAEYWQFVLANIIVVIVLAIIDAVLNTAAIVDLYEVAILLPSLAVLFRRLHDTDKTAWWVLIGLIPLVGTIVLIVFCCQEGTAGPNKYGPSPKGIGAPADTTFGV